MSSQPVPEESVEAFNKAIRQSPDVPRALEAAAPAIHKQEREQVRAALLSKEFEKRIWRSLPPALKAPYLWRGHALHIADTLDGLDTHPDQSKGERE
jgi:hypothetical protein